MDKERGSVRQFTIALLIFASLFFGMAAAVFFIFVDTKPMSRLEYLNRAGRVAFFKFTGLPKLDEAETKFLYINSCTRKCHGKEVVERAKHTPREWELIVKRMRFVHGAGLTDNEDIAIARYLQKNYLSTIPTILSYEANRFLKKYLWKSDFGESDLYVDVIYTPVEYFKLIGNMSDAERYGVDDYIVFLVYLNTHQDKLQQFPMQKLSVLRDGGGRNYEVVDWKVTYESGDMHHREGILRFRKIRQDKGFMELSLMDLPGQKERIFRWEMPLPEFNGK
ncbi:MAG: hypothetical protein HY026_00400 [Deltaproteobacteria bacterium]|nr:hypothetical protein [Deltaproteobacteria bacterium]